MVEIEAMELGIEESTEVVYKIAEIQAHITVILAALPKNEGWKKENTEAFLRYVRKSLDELTASLPMKLSDYAKVADEVREEVTRSYGGPAKH